MEELSPGQLAALSQRLQSLRDELQQLVGQLSQGADPVDLDTPIGRLSRMDAMQQQHLAKASFTQARSRLARVLAAITRIGTGEYGYCLDCEEPVSLKRLRAYPEASLCLRCQAARE